MYDVIARFGDECGIASPQRDGSVPSRLAAAAFTGRFAAAR